MPEDRSRPPTALDRALGAALAELTSAAAPRDLRGRVLARLSAEHARSRGGGSRVRWVVALPAAAGIALVLAGAWLARRTGPTPREASRAVTAVSPAPSAMAPAAPPARLVAPVAPRVARSAPPGRPAGEPRGSVPRTAHMPAGGDQGPGLPSLEPPAALRAADLATVETRVPSPIDVPSLRIAPLADVEDGGLGLP
jgi:hypothetical protein